MREKFIIKISGKCEIAFMSTKGMTFTDFFFKYVNQRIHSQDNNHNFTEETVGLFGRNINSQGPLKPICFLH